MRKQSVLFVCCIALMFFGSAQYSLPAFYQEHGNEIFLKKTDKEKITEQFMKDINFENENKFFRQKLNLQGNC